MSGKKKSRAERRREARSELPSEAPSSSSARWIVPVVTTVLVLAVIVGVIVSRNRSTHAGVSDELASTQPGQSKPTGDTPAKPKKVTPTIYGYKVIKSYPHNPRHYCQGLVYHEGLLYEGTGHYGESLLGRFDLDTGEPVNLIDLDALYFGEGIAIWEDKIIQLTWKENVAFVYDKKTFKKIGSFKYSGEGWGLTHDGTHLILSDGTPTLRFLDPKSYKVVRRLTVKDRGRSLRNLNELEYINGEIYANIYQTDQIVRISPKDGQVVGWIDLTGLLPAAQRRAHQSEVLNGIAYDVEKKRLLVTGKYWPKLYHIELAERKR